MKLTRIEKAVVLEDLMRKVIDLEEEVAVTPDAIKESAIKRRKSILEKFGLGSVKLNELRQLA